MPESSPTDVAERLARLEDERAIMATLYAYGTALDYGDRRLFLDCFTPDAEYVVEMRIGSDAGFRCDGHDALGVYFDGHTHAARRLPQTRHHEPHRHLPREHRHGYQLLPAGRRRTGQWPGGRPGLGSLYRPPDPGGKWSLEDQLPTRRGGEPLNVMPWPHVPDRTCPRRPPPRPRHATRPVPVAPASASASAPAHSGHRVTPLSRSVSISWSV